MPRRMAACCICLANCGRCSLILMPGTLVLIGLKGPPLSVPGLRSKVSLWLGPPSIHKRMQDLVFLFWAAAPWARTLNQPDSDRPLTPAAASFRASRRVSPLSELAFSMDRESLFGGVFGGGPGSGFARLLPG